MQRLSGIKIKVPSFHGMLDPDAYVEWETKIEQYFEYHAYSNVQKVQVASHEFKGYAMGWWDQTIKERKRYGEPPIETWEEMKRMMRRRYASSYYLRELYKKKVEKIEGEKIFQGEEESENVVDEIRKEDCKKAYEEVLPKEKICTSLDADLQENNVEKFWPTIT